MDILQRGGRDQPYPAVLGVTAADNGRISKQPLQMGNLITFSICLRHHIRIRYSIPKDHLACLIQQPVPGIFLHIGIDDIFDLISGNAQHDIPDLFVGRKCLHRINHIKISG